MRYKKGSQGNPPTPTGNTGQEGKDKTMEREATTVIEFFAFNAGMVYEAIVQVLKKMVG